MSLIWLVGPPGSGKSTFVRNNSIPFVELTSMLRPLIDPWGLEKGVLTSNGKLLEIIRTIKRQSDSDFPESLIVVIGCIKESDLFPLETDEEVWLLLPEEEHWQQQLGNRPAKYKETPLYHNIEYATKFYTQYKDWKERGLGKPISTSFNQNLIGKVAEAMDDSK